MFKFFIIFFIFGLANGEPSLDFEVGKAKEKKTRLAYVNSPTMSQSSFIKDLNQRVRGNLAFLDLFDVSDESNKDGEDKVAFINFGNWRDTGYDFVLKISSESTDLQVKINVFIFDVRTKKQLLGRVFEGPKNLGVKISQQISDQIIGIVTGKPSKSFYSRLAFVCNRGTDKKELYMTDWDNSYLEQLTARKSIVYSPDFSPDGRYLAFTSYANTNFGKNLNLYMADLKTLKYRLLSSRKGLHIGPKFNPDGKHLAVTMSFSGNPQLYLIDMEANIISTLAQSWGFDVEGSFSPDGKYLSYVSGRSGKPMVYLRELKDGAKDTQITFAGRYNSHPIFHPDGDTILFSSWVGNGFDLFTIKKDKSNLERLTKDQGTNEDAVYSPDGNFILFSSTRSGRKKVFIMNSTGTKVRQLSPNNLGACEQGAWGKVYE